MFFIVVSTLALTLNTIPGIAGEPEWVNVTRSDNVTELMKLDQNVDNKYLNYVEMVCIAWYVRLPRHPRCSFGRLQVFFRIYRSILGITEQMEILQGTIEHNRSVGYIAFLHFLILREQ